MLTSLGKNKFLFFFCFLVNQFQQSFSHCGSQCFQDLKHGLMINNDAYWHTKNKADFVYHYLVTFLSTEATQEFWMSFPGCEAEVPLKLFKVVRMLLRNDLNGQLTHILQHNRIMDRKIDYCSSIKYYKNMVKIIQRILTGQCFALENPCYIASGTLETWNIRHWWYQLKFIHLISFFSIHWY